MRIIRLSLVFIFFVMLFPIDVLSQDLLDLPASSRAKIRKIERDAFFSSSDKNDCDNDNTENSNNDGSVVIINDNKGVQNNTVNVGGVEIKEGAKSPNEVNTVITGDVIVISK